MVVIVTKLLRLIAGKGVIAMAIYPFILVRDAEESGNETMLNHERIHFRQQIELGLLFFYLLYGAYYLHNRRRGYLHSNAYRNIPFEKEAYANESNSDYLVTRKLWTWAKFR
jgi:hypothetical protein